MLLLDSSTIPERDRADVITSVMADASEATVALDRRTRVHARMELWRFGPVQLFRSASSGVLMSCNAAQSRRGGGPILALAVQERSWARSEQFGYQRQVGPGNLMMVDLTGPFAFSWRTQGASRALQIPVDALNLPVEVIRCAAARIQTSPLAGLMTGHIVDLAGNADRIADDQQAASVGAVSLDLARALIASAAGHDSGVQQDTLLSQVREYVRQNLTDPDLGPSAIADAHNISVRQLYALCARAGFSLEQLIITGRLEGAFHQLAGPGAEHRTIASIAHQWGFRDPAHFARRFKSSYGMTPREHRALALGAP
ncbi:MAG TPA: helix-turn-helix domain-containing protein [Pseudonocardia sp.]|jgi:AraC-like DNA-binding protein